MGIFDAACYGLGVKQAPSSIEERRRKRQRKLVFGKARTFEEHSDQGDAFWRNAAPELKLQAIIELIRDSWYLQGNDGPPPGLDRSAHGVRKLRG